MKYSKGNIVLAALSSVISVIALEIFVRLFFEPLSFIPILTNTPIAHHVKYGYFHRPNYRDTVTRVGREIVFRTNVLGLRNEEISKDDGTYDILAVGNSFTVGFGIDESQAWPKRLEGHLKSNYKSERFKVINAGVSGYNLSQIRLLTEDLVERISPQIVVLGLYTFAYSRLDNPFVYFHGRLVRKSNLSRLVLVDGGSLYTPYNRDWLASLDIWMKKNFWLGAFGLSFARDIYLHFFSDLRTEREDLPNDAGIDYKSRLKPLLYELEKMSSFIEQKHIKFIVLLINHQQEHGNFSDIEFVYNRIVNIKCLNLNLNCVDLLPILIRNSQGGPDFRLENDHHWSPKAHELAAKEVARAIMSWLAKNDGATP